MVCSCWDGLETNEFFSYRTLVAQEIYWLTRFYPALAYPNPGMNHVLDTDFSLVGAGAVLFQKRDGQEFHIAFYSKSFTKAEQITV